MQVQACDVAGRAVSSVWSEARRRVREARRSAVPELGSRVERSDRASVVQAMEYSSSVGISVAQILGGVTLAVKVSSAALAVKAVSAGGTVAAGEAGEERESVGEA